MDITVLGLRPDLITAFEPLCQEPKAILGSSPQKLTSKPLKGLIERAQRLQSIPRQGQYV
jgi:hypothetical protein